MHRPSLVLGTLESHDMPRWDAFVRACPQATFFHLSAWKSVVEQVFRHRCTFLYAERAGEIVGVLPLGEVRSRLFGHSLASLPFCSYGGVAASDEEAALALESRAIEQARTLGADYLELRHLNRRPRASWPLQDMYFAFRKSLPDVLDDKMLCIPQKRRNMVRKAIKLGLKARQDDSIERFFPMYAENVRQHGTPALPRRYFEALKHSFGRDCEILSIDDGSGAGVSTIMAFYFRDEVIAYYAGETSAARNTAANDLKYWELMKRAKERGCTLFDFGRSKRGTGSFEFKRMWGFEADPLYYEYHLLKRDSIPQNNPNNPKYRLFIEAWKRLPLPVANTIGPYIVRSLG